MDLSRVKRLSRRTRLTVPFRLGVHYDPRINIQYGFRQVEGQRFQRLYDFLTYLLPVFLIERTAVLKAVFGQQPKCFSLYSRKAI